MLITLEDFILDYFAIKCADRSCFNYLILIVFLSDLPSIIVSWFYEQVHVQQLIKCEERLCGPLQSFVEGTSEIQVLLMQGP